MQNTDNIFQFYKFYFSISKAYSCFLIVVSKNLFDSIGGCR